MQATTAEADQMDAFAWRAEVLVQSTDPEHASYLHERLQRILVAHCMVPSDEGPRA
jgi:hypothetical protein